MTGKEAIIEKIRADARQKVNSTLEEGARKAQEAIALARADVKIYKDRNMSESYAERDEIINRRITVANLDVKKLILKAKVTAIDKAFEEATKEIKADKSRYLELIKRMIKFADDGDISAYAYGSVYFMAKNHIINGVGDNLFAPKNTTSAQAAANYANATRQQALLISSRTLNQFG